MIVAEMSQIDLFVNERAHLGRCQALWHFIVDHDCAGTWQVAAAKEPEKETTSQGRRDHPIGKIIGQPPRDFFPPAGCGDGICRHRDLDRDALARLHRSRGKLHRPRINGRLVKFLPGTIEVAGPGIVAQLEIVELARQVNCAFKASIGTCHSVPVAFQRKTA